MAEENEGIKYSDIVKPDDAIERLIAQLNDLNTTYSKSMEVIKDGAAQLVKALKNTSGATSEGRKKIDEAAEAAGRLERAQKELAFALSNTGKQVAWLRAQTSEANRTTVEHQKYLRMAATSYDKIKAELKDTIRLYNSLTAEERANAQMGGQLVKEILEYKNQLMSLNAQLKPHVEKLTAVQKAQQKLAFLQSEEGKKLREIQAQIRAVNAVRKEQKRVLTEVEKAKARLQAAMSSENQQVKLLNAETAKQNRLAELNAKIASTAEGSYDRLSAQYSLNKLQLNAMSKEERTATEAGRALEQQTREIYQEMIRLQEATGNYRLSVGNYKKAWDGLGAAVSQVVRELPAAAISLNTFFLGISNNIPILLDEIKALRAQNKALAAEGKPTKNVISSVASAFFSWTNVAVLFLTVMAMHGEEILKWVFKINDARTTALSFAESIDVINKKLAEGTGQYGQNVVAYKKLQDEWSKLDSLKDQEKWVKKTQEAFRDLNIQCNNVNEADRLFVKQTDEVINAFKDRAKAAAAQALAEEKYQEAFVKRQEAANVKDRAASTSEFFQAAIGNYSMAGAAEDLRRAREERIKNLNAEADAAEADAEAFYNLSQSYKAAADAVLPEYEDPEKAKTTRKGRTRQGRDVTEYLESMRVSVRKKYEESETDLMEENAQKRIQVVTDEANAKIRELEKTYMKNERILKNENGLYKTLTDEQKEIIKTAQQEISDTIINYRSKLYEVLEDMLTEEELRELKIQEEGTDLKLRAVKQGSEEELKLRLQALENRRKIAILENRLKPSDEQVSEADINAAFNKEAGALKLDYSDTEFEQQQALAKAQFDIVERTELEITRFKLLQERERWVRLIKLAEEGSLDWSQTQIDTAKATVEGIDNQLARLKEGAEAVIDSIGKKGLLGTLLLSIGFDDEGIRAFDDAVNIIIQNLQEIAQAEVDLAQAAVDAAEERVSAAQSAYEAEVEARSNGYANNVATAKKELQQEKKKQQEKQKLLEQAQKRQETLNTTVQASSLITASANLWSAFSSVPIIGPALALAAITTMWSSFAVAKVKAAQVTSSQEYGEGGLEFLEGGSHASGNDIDLGVNNSRRKRMRAEGGEALAIINKRKTRKYRKVLPTIIDSLNRGTFEETFSKAFSVGEGLSANIFTDVNLSKIENDVRAIKKQNETKYYTLSNGSIVVIHKNVKRIIKN